MLWLVSSDIKFLDSKYLVCKHLALDTAVGWYHSQVSKAFGTPNMGTISFTNKVASLIAF